MRGIALKAVVIAGSCILLLYIILSPRIVFQPPGFPSETVDSEASRPVSSPSPKLENPYSSLNPDIPEQQYRRTLVIAKTAEEDTSWIDRDLGDIVGQNESFNAVTYVADNVTAPYHPPSNRGHEASVYLSYIIEFYEQLPDVAIFMHSHSNTWHNNDLLDTSSAQIVRHLSAEKVVRDGYMNLRCHWEPGCPSWISTQSNHFDDHKTEEAQFSKAFKELFPDDFPPPIFSQPCCAQFAVSAECIRRHLKEKYIFLRNWLQNTELDDHDSGRIFEYSWQYLFTSDPIYCRNMHLCYCDGYSICFPDEHAYVQYIDIQDTRRVYEAELDEWNRKAESGESPEAGRDVQLRFVMDDLQGELDRRKRAASEIGSDRKKKYDILTRAWDELTLHPPGHLAERFGHFGVDSAISPP